MAMETKANLQQDTVDKLNKLIEANIDSRDGFQDAAEKVEDELLATMFRELSQERAAQARELQSYVMCSGEEPENSGSYAAAAHRGLMDVRAALTGGDTHALLSEAERGEDYIKDKYEDVLEETAGSAVNDVLQRQYACVKAAHDRIRALRDDTKIRRSSK